MATLTRFLGYGFRPFFLFAGLYAALLIPLWLLALTGTQWSAAIATGIRWHAHELYFGFVGAAVAGFLLTAVANWTGRPPVRGVP
ncbi:MAG: NnrS family protein, partial [Bauldia litoralis]